MNPKFLLFRLQIALIMITLVYKTLAQINLIQNGDFEYHPPYNESCGITCLFTEDYRFVEILSSEYYWYDNFGSYYQIREKKIPPFNTVTSMFDSISDKPTQLCQTIKPMNINANYLLTFDYMISDVTNCGNVIIKWNFIKIDNTQICTIKKVFKYARLITSTQANNTICFEGTTNTILANLIGPLIDNVTLTLQINTNCSVSHCLSCLDIEGLICLVCQTNYSLLNGSCFQPSNYSSQNITQNVLTTKRIYVYFKFNIEQGSQNFNTYILNTNITQKEFFALESIKTITKIYIDNQILDNYAVFLNQNGCVAFQIQTKRHYSKYSKVSISFIGNLTYLNNTQIIFMDAQTNMIANIYIDSNDQKALKIYDQISGPIVQTLDLGFKTIKIFGFGYFIFNLFSFWNLSILYNFLNLNTPKFMKGFIENIFSNSIMYGIFKVMKIETIVYNNIPDCFTEKIPQSRTSWYWFKEFGFTSNYLKNNIQPYFLILTSALRIFLFMLCYYLVKWRIFNVFNKKFLMVCNDWISMLPFVIIPSASVLLNPINITFMDKINTNLHFISLNISILTPFIYFIVNYLNIKKKLEKKKITKKKYFEKFIQSIVTLLDNFFLVIVSLFVGLKLLIGFFIINTILIITLLYLTIKYRATFECQEKIQKILMKVIWVIYHFIFVAFFILKFLANYINDPILQIIQKYLGFLGIFLILFGGVIEIIFIVITFLLFIVKVVKKIIRLKTIKPTLQSPKNDIQKKVNLQKNQKPDQIPKKQTIKLSKMQNNDTQIVFNNEEIFKKNIFKLRKRQFKEKAIQHKTNLVIRFKD